MTRFPNIKKKERKIKFLVITNSKVHLTKDNNKSAYITVILNYLIRYNEFD